MRSSSEEAVSQLNKWKSESASVLVSTTGRLTFALVGRISHVSSTEVHIEIPGADSRDFSLSISLRGSTFEYHDRRELPEVWLWKPQRDEGEFESMLAVLLEDGRGKRIVLSELRSRDI